MVETKTIRATCHTLFIAMFSFYIFTQFSFELILSNIKVKVKLGLYLWQCVHLTICLFISLFILTAFKNEKIKLQKLHVCQPWKINYLVIFVKICSENMLWRSFEHLHWALGNKRFRQYLSFWKELNTITCKWNWHGFKTTRIAVLIELVQCK